jgi:hypothetical protein
MSLGSVHILGFDSDLPINPGICWGMSKKFYLKMKSINPFFIDGGGDSGLVSEILNTKNRKYDTYLYNFKWFHSIYRKFQPKAILSCVDVDIVHVNHGEFRKRNYNTIRYALDKIDHNITEYVVLDNNRLLRWVDPNCLERKFTVLRPQMDTNETVDKMYSEIFKK